MESYMHQIEIEAEIERRVAEALAVQAADHARAMDLLAAESKKPPRSGKPKSDRYAAFARWPDLCDLIQATDLRPGALPSLCAIEVWKGSTTASEIALIIPLSPKSGEGKGGTPTTPAIISKALDVLAIAFMTANKGLGIKVEAIRDSGGDSKVRKYHFQPSVEIEEPAVRRAA
jgi:hypothetical protein